MRNVRVIITLAVMIALGNNAFADSANGDRTRVSGKRLEHVGEWLTGAAAVHLVAGLPPLVVGTIQSRQAVGDNWSLTSFGYEIAGGACVGISGVLLAIGVPLWIAGHKRHLHEERMALAPNKLTLTF
jgi:hypothetical protein